ncbi:serine/threonine-protein kinase [Moorena sp. SIO4G3]|uniref:serine/threonine-protein kinase n=1 Tax=Moorena sp. SIO4G3 TaxID=2607821 RepID=UPI00142A570C|nr:serine/threonine-protein kinase [Moorena sp. SIO4G3]NEO81019.1 serine/threonine protein kinase [Moorena sp. SIO4G3]
MTLSNENFEDKTPIQILLKEARRNKNLKAIFKYENFEELGSGGFGTVYKAREIKSAKDYAIKVLLTTEDADTSREYEDEKRFQRFKREISILKGFENDNIVQYFDDAVCDATGICFIVMEYCNAGNVADLIEKGRVPDKCIENYLAIIIQALDGLIELHENDKIQGIHRDIKPENILICYENDTNKRSKFKAKLGDFGLAKAFDSASLTSISPIRSNTESSQRSKLKKLQFSPQFTSRNLIRDWKNATPQTDVWSMAATLYYMLTDGDYPRDFSNISDELDIIEVIRKSKPISIRERNASIHKDLVNIIDKALNEYDDYYSTGAEFQQDLIRFVESQNSNNR